MELKINKQSEHQELIKAAGTIHLQAREEERNGAQYAEIYSKWIFLSFLLCNSKVEFNPFINQGFGF